MPALKFTQYGWLIVWLLSVPVKLVAAQHMPFDIDYVPVLSRGYEWLQGGAFPSVGTLSSVAAFNMPMLQWLHLPALAFTQNAFFAILLTMLMFNLLTTWAVFRLGHGMVNWRVGLIAATLFTFSETGVTSAYTAWAQQLLSGFYVLTALCLWEWYAQKRGVFLALTGMIATAAFMTHFSAIVLFPAMLIFALLSRSRWQIRWLLVGIVGSFLLLAPYLSVQVQRDFADIRAFLTQDTLVPPDVMAEFDYLKPGAGALGTTSAVVQTEASPISEPVPQAQNVPRPSRFERIVAFGLSLPEQFVRGLNFAFSGSYRGLEAVAPVLGNLGGGFLLAWQISFWASLIIIGERLVQRRRPKTDPQAADMHLFWMASMLLIVVSVLIITGNIDQPTYFMGLAIWQWLIIAYGVEALRQQIEKRFFTIVLIGLISGFVLLNNAERLTRVVTYDETQHSIANISQYRFIAAATDFIAADFEGDSLTVRYDILPESRNLWWVIPWNTIDETYRMGMSFDFLLDLHHGLTNTNTDAIGAANNPDYLVIYAPALERYDQNDFSVHRFGTVLVLQPM